jgi:hypothetical protein
MLARSKMLLTALLALVALTAVASSATAASISIRPGGAITATSNGKMTFESNVFGLGPECRVELIGSLNTGPINKVAGASLGSISSARVTECTGGAASALFRSPTTWGLTYNSIAGTLPEAVTSALLFVNSAQFLVEIPGGANCLYVGRVGSSLALTRIRAAEYSTGNLEVLETGQVYSTITRLAGGFFNCPTAPTLFGSFRVTAQTVTRT